MIDNLRQTEIMVGTGDNRFKMSRGSFNYRQTIKSMTRLRRKSVVEKTNGFEVHYETPISKIPYTLNVTTDSDGLIKAELLSEEKNRHNRFWLSFPADPEEHIYGGGETYSEFDLKGKKVRVFVAEHQNAKRIAGKMIREAVTGKRPNRKSAFKKYETYYAQPTFVSSKKYFVHADINGYSQFRFGKKRTMIYTQELPVFYFRKADSFEDLSYKLSCLIGRQGELPDWIYDGAILAVQQGTEIIDEKISRVTAMGTKVCGIWSQDWCGCRKTGFGYQVMWNWEWDRELYKDLDVKIREWKEKGIRFLGYINPFMAIEKDLYKYASEHGYCVKDKKGKDYLVTITTFPAAMIDFTNPEAYEWYKEIIKKNMIGLGMGGWMADFGEYLPMDCVLHSGEDPEYVHNRWPAIWAKLNREAVEECGVGDEVFFFTRAGHTGTVSASMMMWTGDQHVDWSVDDGLPSVIPATLSLAMCGFGVTHSDVGGYTTIMKMRRSKELLMRWEEMNAFSPLFRSHEGNQPANNVQFDDDEELIRQLSRMSRIHTELKPYLKKLVKENAERAIPVIRPLFYHYDEEKAFTEKTEYLLGRDLLVAPVLTQGASGRKVYLPDDRWVHLFSGKEYGGGEFEIDAPIGKPPVFIRKESPDFADLIELQMII